MTITKHKNRKLISISKSGAVPFLQSLITCDISSAKAGDLFYSAFLTPQGRFLYDFFILVKSKDELYVDIEEGLRNKFTTKLKRYKLGHDVSIEALETNIEVIQVFGGEDGIEEGGYNESDIMLKNLDPRKNNMGYRYYFTKEQSIKYDDYDKYIENRIKNKVIEGCDLIREKSLILEYDFERLNAVSFDKGCYLGQELTTRIKRTGQIRKELVTLDLNKDNIEEFKSKKSARVMSQAGGLALGIQRIDYNE